MAKKRPPHMGLMKGERLIDDDFKDNDALYRFRDDLGEIKGRGYDPGTIKSKLKNTFSALPSEIAEIPESGWKDRLDELNANEALLSQVRMRGDGGTPIVSLDQNGQGYCWYYSTTMTVMIRRAAMNMPYLRFSAHAGACDVKNFRDEGGWCGLSCEHWRKKGCPTVAKWPEKSMSRSYSNPDTWANAALHKITEGFYDLNKAAYDQELTFNQLAACLMSGIPCAVDFNWWGHSVCALDLVLVEAGSWGIRILNSWTDQWGERGTSVLRGSKARPDNAIATSAIRPSVAAVNPCQGPQSTTAV